MSGIRSVLLVSPTFHGYWQAVEACLQRRGYAVTTVRYDENLGPVAKARHKALVELPRRLGRATAGAVAAAHTARAVEALRASNPDACLVLKGDTLGEEFWDGLDDRLLPRVTWLYDEVRRTAYTDAALAAHGPVASYSPLDVAALRTAGVHAAHVPLGHDALLPFTPLPSDRVTFVGARYANRVQLLRSLSEAGVGVHAYGRDWSHAWRDRARTWRLRAGPVPASGDLPRAQAYAVMAGSAATLNIHGDQDGFTMRTFEACGVGGVQLVDRADVSLHYEPGREVAVFSDAQELVELVQRAHADRDWSRRLREAGRRRTLAEHTLEHRVRDLEALWSV